MHHIYAQGQAKIPYLVSVTRKLQRCNDNTDFSLHEIEVNELGKLHAEHIFNRTVQILILFNIRMYSYHPKGYAEFLHPFLFV